MFIGLKDIVKATKHIDDDCKRADLQQGKKDDVWWGQISRELVEKKQKISRGYCGIRVKCKVIISNGLA